MFLTSCCLLTFPALAYTDVLQIRKLRSEHVINLNIYGIWILKLIQDQELLAFPRSTVFSGTRKWQSVRTTRPQRIWAIHSLDELN
jgi:hypothetical protein